MGKPIQLLLCCCQKLLQMSFVSTSQKDELKSSCSYIICLFYIHPGSLITFSPCSCSGQGVEVFSSATFSAVCTRANVERFLFKSSHRREGTWLVFYCYVVTTLLSGLTVAHVYINNLNYFENFESALLSEANSKFSLSFWGLWLILYQKFLVTCINQKVLYRLFSLVLSEYSVGVVHRSCLCYKFFNSIMEEITQK